MEKNFSLNSSPNTVAPLDKELSFARSGQELSIEDLRKKKAELQGKIEAGKKELDRRNELEKLIRDSKAELERRRKLENLKQKTNQFKSFLTKTKHLLLLAGLSVGAVAMAVKPGDSKQKKISKYENVFDSNDSVEKNKQIEDIAAPVLEKMDTAFYNELTTDSAKARYISFIEQDLQGSDSTQIESDSTSNDSTKMESDSKIVSEEDIMSLLLAKFESGGAYFVENDSSSAKGKYQFLAYTWFGKIGLNPNSQKDVDSFLTHPELQEKLFHVAYGAITGIAEDNAQIVAAREHRSPTKEDYYKQFLGTFFVGEGNALKYNTAAGSVRVKKNRESINELVNKRYRELEEVLDATKDGGRWVFDDSHEDTYTDRDGDKHSFGNLYFIGPDYKVKYEMRMPEIMPGDKNTKYLGTVGGENIKNQSYVVLEHLKQKARTVNYAQEVSKQSSSNTKIVLTTPFGKSEKKVFNKKNSRGADNSVSYSKNKIKDNGRES